MKILIVRVGRTGDMVMATPALSALLHHYPDAEFTLLTGPEGRRTLGDFSPRITALWRYDPKRRLTLLAGSGIRKKIASASFDQIYCFEYKPRYYDFFRGSQARVHGLRNFKSNTHYAQLCLDLVSEGVGSEVGPYPLFLPVDARAIEENRDALAGIGIHETTTLLAVHPTYNAAGKRFGSKTHRENKRWPSESYGVLCDRLQADAKRRGIDLRIVMNLMPEECALGEKIVACSRGSVNLFSPEPDFHAYKAFLKRADLLVTPDTGPMHIAAALGTPVVALFAGKDPGDCGPFVPASRRRILRAEDTKAPEQGIAAIGVDAVFAACIAMLGARSLSRS